MIVKNLFLSLLKQISIMEENQNQIKRREELELVSNMVTGSPFSPEQIGVIQKSVAKKTTTAELAYFLNVCQSVGLNPFNKEVWCYKDHKGNLIIFTGRDGLLRKAQENPAFAGIRSSEVRENDVFEIDIANNKIKHQFTGDERGAIIGAYSVVFRKDGEATIEWVKFEDYYPANASGFSPWKRFPAAMIKKVAESHALKKAFGMSGVQVEYDFEIRNGVASPKGIQPQKEDHEYAQLKRFIEEANGAALATLDLTLLEPYEDLRKLYDEKMDELMTQDTESEEVSN